ncbi:MAG TPA: nucleotide exchange factor GrpE [Chthoniobacterales bacterium]|nr:nucleotide exchange factor GrpE [Chthoniobacterales bacterium]
MSNVVEATDEFATAMQQLSAEAEKSLPLGQPEAAAQLPSASDQNLLRVLQELSALSGRMQNTESALAERIEQLAKTLSPAEQVNIMVSRFEKIDEQLASIRSTESVNQKLFDSLHAELRAYRDNFLHDSLQKPFIHDLVLLFDHLTSLHEQLRTAAQEKGKRSPVCQWRDHLENAIASLVEVLHRLEVREIEPKETVDRALHRVVSFEPADYPEEDGRIVMRVRRGFLWRGKLIRPEEVIAKRFN